MADSPPLNGFPVFVDTNLGTHLAMSISPETTAGELKRKLRKEHQLCFPDLGEFKTHALMMKFKSCFYHIPDSVPLKIIFNGLKDAWFLRATCLEHVGIQGASMDQTDITKQRESPQKPFLATAGGFQQYGPTQQGFQPTFNYPTNSHEKNDILELCFDKLLEADYQPSLQDAKNEHDLILDTPEFGSIGSSEAKRAAIYDAKMHNQHSSCPEDQAEGLSTSSCNPNKKGILKKKCSSTDAQMKLYTLSNVVNLFENARKEDSEETKRHVVTHNNNADRTANIGRRVAKVKFCKNNLSRIEIESIKEGRQGTHCCNGLESNSKSSNVNGQKLCPLQNDFHLIQHSDNKISPNSQTLADHRGLVNEALDKEGMTSSESDIISVTGIITRYFFESNEVTSQNSRLSNAANCSNQTHCLCSQNEDACDPLASHAVKGDSRNTEKERRKHKNLNSIRKGIMTPDDKGRNNKCKDKADEHPIGHKEEKVKDGDTSQGAICSPLTQFSIQWSSSPAINAPKGKPKRSDVGKRFLHAVNGLGISRSKRKPQNKYCSRLPRLNSFTLSKSRIFDINDADN